VMDLAKRREADILSKAQANAMDRAEADAWIWPPLTYTSIKTLSTA
jgi:hypothetical protein